jgi:hypothetical protein
MNPQDFNLTKPAYSINEALDILPFGRTTLYAEVKAGRLIATKLGDKTILLAPHIAAYLASLPSIPHSGKEGAE